MYAQEERRKEERLYCDWPIWFAEGRGKKLYHGEILNISSKALAFVCRADRNLPHPGSNVTTYFSVPHAGCCDSSDVVVFSCTACVYRIDTLEDRSLRRVVFQFDKLLPFKPSKISAVNRIFSARPKYKSMESKQLSAVQA